ncbi:MAG: hypothetical protein C0501_00850 [Isosphaera sp.]|nr:hypothetical protein [Isosphaera sp.]
MRGLMWAGGLAAVLAAGPGPADDKTYDLRGPAPTEKKTVVSKKKSTIKGADVTLKAAGQTIDGKQTLVETTEEEVKVLAVDGRQVTKAQTRVVKDEADTVLSVFGQEMKESKKGDLHGEVIVSERTGPGKWKHRLVDNKPTEKQQKELDKRVGPENEDDLYPPGKVKVGHEWEVDAAVLQRLLGGAISDLKGKMKLKFLRVEDVDGEECAVVESSGKITGVAKEDEGDLAIELDVKGLTWRSLKTGVDVRDKAEGKVKMSGKIDMDGVKADIVVSGPIVIEGTAKLK